MRVRLSKGMKIFQYNGGLESELIKAKKRIGK